MAEVILLHGSSKLCLCLHKTLNKRSLEQGANGLTLRMTLRITVGSFAEQNWMKEKRWDILIPK